MRVGVACKVFVDLRLLVEELLADRMHSCCNGHFHSCSQ